MAAQRELEGHGFCAKRSRAHAPGKAPTASPLNGMALSCGAASLRNRLGQHPGTGQRQPGSLGRKRIDRSGRDLPAQRRTLGATTPMFDISCGDDGGPASCGIFGGSVGGGAAKQPQTLAGLLKKLDLSEYEPKFVAAGITDVLLIRVPIPVAALHTNSRRSPPSPSCQKRSSTSSTCASSRNGSCGTTSRAPGCPTASRCGARRVSTKS